MKTLPHPPYSPDIAPNDFWFYPRLKKGSKGCHFQTLDQLEQAVNAELALILVFEYSEAILQKWPMRWGRCVHNDRGYFEGIRQ